ncbi:thioredoxin domain-containing protein [Sinorhizobium meliloti]|nr:thioredoxin domain-containing protein [Sinorhizobium meliloti]
MKTSKGLIALLALTTAVNIGLVAGNYRIVSAGTPPEAIGTLEFDPEAKSTLVAPPLAQNPAGRTGDAEIDSMLAEVDAVIAESKRSREKWTETLANIDAGGQPSVSLAEEQVRRLVRDEITSDPKFVLDALNAHMQEQQAEEAQNADKKVVEMASAVTVDEGYPFVGKKDAKVELFYYFDVNCGFCKKIDAELRRFVEGNPDVKLVHREMPILTPASNTAAHIGGTLFELYPEGYSKFHDLLLASPQASTPDTIEAALVEAVGKDKAAEVISKSFNINDDGPAKDVDARIKATLATADEAGINGTPFIYVKGADVFVRGAAPDLFVRLSDAAAKVRK